MRKISIIAACLLLFCLAAFLRPVKGLESAAPASQVLPGIISPQEGTNLTVRFGQPVFAQLDAKNPKESLIVPSEDKIYIFKDGAMTNSLDTYFPVIRLAITGDLDGDGLRDLVCGAASGDFDEVRALSSGTGRAIWTFRPVTELYDAESGRYSGQAPVALIKSFADKGSLVLAGETAYMLESTTGRLMWRYDLGATATDACIFTNAGTDGSLDVAIGDGSGRLTGLDGDTGSRLWSRQLSEPFKVKNASGQVIGSADRPVWSVKFIEGASPSIAASAENGLIYQLDPTTGENKTEPYTAVVFSDAQLDTYYTQLREAASAQDWPSTGPEDGNYFNVRVLEPADINHDGTNDVLAATFISGDPAPAVRYAGERIAFFALDGVSGAQIWRNDSPNTTPDAGVPVIKKLHDKLKITVPQNVPAGYSLAVIDAETGANEQSLTASAYSMAYLWQSDHLSQPGGNVYGADRAGDFLVRTGDGSISLLDIEGKNALWTIKHTGPPECEFSGRFNILLKYTSAAGTGRYSAIKMYDALAESEAWTFRAENLGGAGAEIGAAAFIGDINADGITDVAAAVAKQIPSSASPDAREWTLSVIDGSSGTLLKNRQLSEITRNITALSAAGPMEIFVQTEAGFYMVDADTTLIKSSGGESGKKYFYAGEGQIFAIGRSTVDIAPAAGGSEPKNIFTAAAGETDISLTKPVADSDADRIFEIAVAGPAGVYRLISGKDGKVIFGQPGKTFALSPAGADLNGNTYKEWFTVTGGTNFSTLQAVDGYDGKPVKTVQLQTTSAVTDGICAVDDQTGDNLPDIAVLQDHTNYTAVAFYDTASEETEPFKTLYFGTYDTGVRKMYAPGKMLTYFASDLGGKYLAMTSASGMLSGLTVLDMTDGRPVAGFDGDSIKYLGGDIAALTDGGNFRGVTRLTRSLALNDLIDQSKVGSPLSVSWKTADQGESISLVYMDGTAYARSQSDKATFKAPAGGHVLTVKNTDRWGKTQYATVEVDVRKSGLPVKAVYIITLAMLLALFIPRLHLKRVLAS